MMLNLEIDTNNQTIQMTDDEGVAARFDYKSGATIENVEALLRLTVPMELMSVMVGSLPNMIDALGGMEKVGAWIDLRNSK